MNGHQGIWGTMDDLNSHGNEGEVVRTIYKSANKNTLLAPVEGFMRVVHISYRTTHSNSYMRFRHSY